MLEQNNQPKKKKNKIVSSTLSDTNLSGAETTSKKNVKKDPDYEYINSILKQTMERYQESVNRQVADYNEDLTNLQNIALEYLDDFIIIGHTPDDRRVIMRYASNPKDFDALKELSREFLVKMMIADKMEED